MKFLRRFRQTASFEHILIPLIRLEVKHINDCLEETQKSTRFELHDFPSEAKITEYVGG